MLGAFAEAGAIGKRRMAGPVRVRFIQITLFVSACRVEFSFSDKGLWEDSGAVAVNFQGGEMFTAERSREEGHGHGHRRSDRL
jgi:hypothetical protein